MDINSLVIFFKVAESLSFTKASKILGVPKSTITRKIIDLENDLNHKLFIRTTRKINLTKEGVFLYEKAKVHYQALQNIEQELKDESVLSGEIRITCTIEHKEYLLEKIIKFKEIYPLTNFYLNFSNNKEDLISEGFDFAFRGGVVDINYAYALKLYSETIDYYIHEKFYEKDQHINYNDFHFCCMKNYNVLEDKLGNDIQIDKKIVSNSIDSLIIFAREIPSLVIIPEKHAPKDFIKINSLKSTPSDFNLVYLNKEQNKICRLFLEYMKQFKE